MDGTPETHSPASTPAAIILDRAATVAALLKLEFLDTTEAAQVVKAHASTIRRACNVRKGGTLPHVRMRNGRVIRIRPADLLRWMRTSTT